MRQKATISRTTVTTEIGQFDVYYGGYAGDRMDAARRDTLVERSEMAKQLLHCAMTAENHWLAASYIAASHDMCPDKLSPDVDSLRAKAGYRMRRMSDEDRNFNASI